MSPAVSKWLLISGGALVALAGICLQRIISSQGDAPVAAPILTDVAAPVAQLGREHPAAVRPVAAENRTTPPAPPPVSSQPTEDVHSRFARLMSDVELMGTSRGWEQAYKDASPETLKQEVDRIEALIYEATRDEFEFRFSTGMGVETLSSDSVYTAQHFDPTAVYWVRIHPGGPVQRVTLPREEFPEIYELKARSAWLRNALQEQRIPDAHTKG